MATTHDWAKQLQDTANYLLNRPAVELGDTELITTLPFYGEEQKKIFLDLVRGTLPGEKRYNTYSVLFLPRGVNLKLQINRDAVCRRVQEIKYECEPLLSPEEDAQMEDTSIPIDAPGAQAIRHDQQVAKESQ
jgi:hypothetical protein